MSTGAFVFRWVILTLLAFAIAIACVLFGKWQWTRTQEIVEIERAQLSAPVNVIELTSTSPGSISDGLGRAVTATGTYAATKNVVIEQRLLGNEQGVWVVTGLQLPDGSTVPVLRGWLPSDQSPGIEPPTGDVTVSGVITKYEKFYANAAGSQPITMSEEAIRTAFGSQTRNAIVWLSGSDPNVQPAPRPIPPEVAIADVPFPWQNFFYAFQWWVFAAFAIVLWVRWLTIDVRARRSAATVGTS